MQQQRSSRPLRILPVLALALLGAACSSSAPGLVYATGTGSVTGDGLHRVRWSQMGSEFVKPGAQLGGYDKVLLEPLAINSTAKDERRRMGPVKQYAPTPSYLDGLRRTYLEMFSKQFGRDGFSVVAEPGPGVLRISGLVIDLVLTARLDPEADTTTTELITSFGDLSLLLDVRDSTSGEPLLRTVDQQAISQGPLLGAYQNITGANLGAQREVFAHEALLLRQEIRQLQNMGTVPAPPP
ncbi:MAG: DUF3313 family protein, partial [Myxococcales bacterium]